MENGRLAFPVRSARARDRYVSAAEQDVLGNLLVRPAAWAAVAPLLQAEDFSPPHQVIFRAMAALVAEGAAVNPITVADRLAQVQQLEQVGGLANISQLARETVTENVRASALVVRDRAVRRRLQELGAEGVDGAELLERVEREAARLRAGAPAAVVAPLSTEPVSMWAERPAPAPRDWIIQGLVPACRLTSFLADGGLGKTTIALQIGVHVAVSRALYGLPVKGGPVLGIFCEDEQDELQRRLSAACAAEQLELAEIDRLVVLSRDGEDNVLATFENDRMVLTAFYRQLEATVAQYQPRLLILDTLADLFAGKYLETTHVRQFTKTALGGLCRRHGCAVLLVAHPSTTGIDNGRGDGFSTAWNNSVRSRLYLRRPKSDDPEAAQDRRVLELKKANYGPGGVSVPLLWRAGAFVPDEQPIEEPQAARAPKLDTRLALAARDYFYVHAPGGAVIGFRTVLEALQASGELPPGDYQTVRKPLQRVLKNLELAGVIKPSQVPRGYRLSDLPRGQLRGQAGDNPGTPGLRGHGDTRDTPSGCGVPCPERSPTDVPGGDVPSGAQSEVRQ